MEEKGDTRKEKEKNQYLLNKYTKIHRSWHQEEDPGSSSKMEEEEDLRRSSRMVEEEEE